MIGSYRISASLAIGGGHTTNVTLSKLLLGANGVVAELIKQINRSAQTR